MYPWFEELWSRLSKHPAHAILLDASDGWAIDRLALYWSQSQLCDAVDEQGHPCGLCVSCHSIEVKAHPDMALLVPETYAIEHDWPLDPKIQDALDKKERKPSRVIKIDQVREVLEFAQRTASRRGPKVIWIHPAEALTTESANALLKTLEEPVPGLRFILSSEHADSLIPTIRSRCQRLSLSDIDEDSVLRWLQVKSRESQPQRSEADVHAAWLASAKQPMRALRWLAHDSFSSSAWNQLPEQIARGQGGCMIGWGVSDQLNALQMCAHDWFRVMNGVPPRFFDSLAFSSGLKPHARKCTQWMHALTREMLRIDHPLNAQVSLHAWLAQSQSVFHLDR